MTNFRAQWEYSWIFSNFCHVKPTIQLPSFLAQLFRSINYLQPSASNFSISRWQKLPTRLYQICSIEYMIQVHILQSLTLSTCSQGLQTNERNVVRIVLFLRNYFLQKQWPYTYPYDPPVKPQLMAEKETTFAYFGWHWWTVNTHPNSLILQLLFVSSMFIVLIKILKYITQCWWIWQPFDYTSSLTKRTFVTFWKLLFFTLRSN